MVLLAHVPCCSEDFEITLSVLVFAHSRRFRFLYLTIRLTSSYLHREFLQVEQLRELVLHVNVAEDDGKFLIALVCAVKQLKLDASIVHKAELKVFGGLSGECFQYLINSVFLSNYLKSDWLLEFQLSVQLTVKSLDPADISEDYDRELDVRSAYVPATMAGLDVDPLYLCLVYLKDIEMLGNREASMKV